METVKIEIQVTKAENGYVIQIGERVFIADRRYSFNTIFEDEGKRIFDAFMATQEQEGV
jgi:hypothetical protein